MGYALAGIKLGIKEERNMRIDMVAMFFVWFHMQFYSFTAAEKAVVVLVTFLIPASSSRYDEYFFSANPLSLS